MTRKTNQPALFALDADGSQAIEQRRIESAQAVRLYAPPEPAPVDERVERALDRYFDDKPAPVAPPAEPETGAGQAEPPKLTEWQQRVEKMLTAIASGASVKGDIDDILRAIDESGLVVIGLVWTDNAPIPTLYV